MRVRLTDPVTYLTGQRRKLTGPNVIVGTLYLLVGPWPLLLFRECTIVLSLFFVFCFAAFCGVRAKKVTREARIRAL